MLDNGKLKVYYDAEFTGLNQNSQLISIGLVTEYGNWFYAEFTDYDPNVSGWIQDNVINNLILTDKDTGAIVRLTPYRETICNIKLLDHSYNYDIRGTKEEVRDELKKWLKTLSKFYRCQIQIYSDCYAYDWVLFNNLICDDGDALNIPDYIYYIPIDLSTALQLKGIDPDITREELLGERVITNMRRVYPFNNMGEKCKHNSLWDALICKLCFEYISR